MPGKVKVRVLAGRNLPVMDRSSDTTDAFVEVRLGDTTYKTDVRRKTLNPVWNSEWFRFDVDDLDLQDEPLQIRIMDYDTYSANDAIGKVYIDLNPLLWSSKTDGLVDVNLQQPDKDKMRGCMSGWLPIYDTLHGVRGEINVHLRVELFSDLNRFRQSSCGVQFFRTAGIPEGYKAVYVNGFVEELVMNDDPEYQWIDKIRTPRASNEARQVLFLKMSGAIQRKIGLKALELGGNAVLGYQQKFDLESDNIVVRGIGTAVTLAKQQAEADSCHTLLCCPGSGTGPKDKESTDVDGGVSGTQATGDVEYRSPDDANCSPRGFNLIMHPANEKQFSSSSKNKYSNRVGITPESLELLEYPFITLKTFPCEFIYRLGGLVSCRSVKLLDAQQEDSVASRDFWWLEIRREIRSHARSLGCNVVVGYTEDTVIWEDIIILCASGTAAVANLSYMLDLESVGLFGPPFKPMQPAKGMLENSDVDFAAGSSSSASAKFQCSLVHIPYADISLPYECKVSKCRACGKGPVPDVLFCTVEPPHHLEIVGRGCLMQAMVVRQKKDLKGENNAKEVSDALPFIEYELHRQLTNKLRVKGMNSLFNIKFYLTFNDRTIMAITTATGYFVRGLPAPRPPQLASASSGAMKNSVDDPYLLKMQRRLETKFAENLVYYGIEKAAKGGIRSTRASSGGGAVGGDDEDHPHQHHDKTTDESSSTISTPATATATAAAVMGEEAMLDADGQEADLSSGNKDCFILEIEDSDDVDILDSLMDHFPPPWIQVTSSEQIVGVGPGHIVKCCQTFCQVWSSRIQPTSRDLSTACRRLMSLLYFKLRRLKPCILCSVDFKADLNEENELQISIYGCAVCLSHSGKTRQELASELESLDKDESQDAHLTSKAAAPSSARQGKCTNPVRISSRSRTFFYSDVKEDQHTINVTPLPYVPGARIDKYLGSLNFFLIRETSSLRENGGLNTFVQSFICEIFSIMRAHVSALGGNALVSYFISDLVVMPSLHKNQAQCLVHAGGDAVQIAYLPPT